MVTPTHQLPDQAALFEHAPCGLLSTETNGLIVRVNNTFCQWTGYQAEQLVGKIRIQELLNSTARASHQALWGPLLETQGSVSEIQLQITHQDGHRIPMMLNAIRHSYPTGMFDEIAMMITTDRQKYEQELLTARRSSENELAARKAVQMELQESQDVLSIALRGAKMGVWSRDFQTRKTWWSRELEELLGLSEGSFDGSDKAFYGLVHKDDRAQVKKDIEDTVNRGKDYHTEFRIRHFNGAWKYVEGRGRVTFDSAGRALTMFGIMVDITDRHVADSKLRQLNEELSLADRRKDEFLATLAHELRNPLAPMRNVIEIMKLKNLDDPDLVWAREIFERQVEHMSHLVADLMEASRLTQGKLELRRAPVDLARAMRESIEATRSMLESAGHTLKVSFPEQAIVLNADHTRLIQMFSNLINNAAKYTPAGGYIEFTAKQEEDEAVITVHDSGIGISQEYLPNIFAMFSQLAPALERSQGGLGIGLALVKGLVELHGGSIQALSKGLGYGSDFTIRLPMPTVKAEIELLTAPNPVPLNTKRCVLIVDDNPDIADTLAMALDLLGFEVITANDGLKAIDIASKRIPEVILLDIGLPEVNGYEIAKRIRLQGWGKDIFLVAVTGWGQEKDKLLAIQAGFDRHLTKPINLDDLIGTLH